MGAVETQQLQKQIAEGSGVGCPWFSVGRPCASDSLIEEHNGCRRGLICTNVHPLLWHIDDAFRSLSPHHILFPSASSSAHRKRLIRAAALRGYEKGCKDHWLSARSNGNARTLCGDPPIILTFLSLMCLRKVSGFSRSSRVIQLPCSTGRFIMKRRKDQPL